MQTTHIFDMNGVEVSAHRHINPDESAGGWVEDTAYVAPTVYLAYNAEVSGNAKVYDYVNILGCAKVSGNAYISDFAQISGYACIYDNARVSGHSRLSGNSAIRNCRLHNSWVKESLFQFPFNYSDLDQEEEMEEEKA